MPPRPVDLTSFKTKHFTVTGGIILLIIWLGWDARGYYEQWVLSQKDQAAVVAVNKLDNDLKLYFETYVTHRELSQKFRELGALNTNVSRDDGTSGLKLPEVHPTPPVNFQPGELANP